MIMKHLSFVQAVSAYRKVLVLVFSIIFLVQFCHLISRFVRPTQLNTVMEMVRMDQLEEFPLLFKFCVRPGLNATVLEEHGYSSVDQFFWGWTKSSYNDIGWAGDKALISPAGRLSDPGIPEV